MKGFLGRVNFDRRRRAIPADLVLPCGPRGYKIRVDGWMDGYVWLRGIISSILGILAGQLLRFSVPHFLHLGDERRLSLVNEILLQASRMHISICVHIILQYFVYVVTLLSIPIP